jgi:hypothetical protein
MMVRKGREVRKNWKRKCALTWAIAVAALFFLTGEARATVIDFEGLDDGTAVTSQYDSLGVTFSGATAITAGMSLNEYEFPPHSGTNVVFDDGGPITITFASAVNQVGGYFTYSEPLTIIGYGKSGSILETVTSAFSSNLALSGDPGSSPNEFLQLTSSSGFYSVVIEADPLGSSFTLDDLTFTASPQNLPLPEPATFLLFANGLFGVFFCLRKRLQ